MLLEQLVRKAQTRPEFDWDSYYRWYFSKLAGREVTEVRFWECPECHTINPIYLPAKYGKCHHCKLIQLP